MGRELSFRRDLYQGTAPYYDRYRPPYPDVLLEDLARRLKASGAGRLLDLACGTGQIAFPLAKYFLEVVALDQEAESVAFAISKAKVGGITNIRWLTGTAEDIELDGMFNLVAVGNAFHRLDRPAVAARMFSWLEPGAAVALIWGGIPGRGDQPWHQAISALFREWISKLGVEDRVPARWERAMALRPHSAVLAEAGFDYLGKFDFPVEQTWTVESLVGFALSTSFLNRTAVGDRMGEFEQELADRLGGFAKDGAIHESANYAYELALKPALP